MGHGGSKQDNTVQAQAQAQAEADAAAEAKRAQTEALIEQRRQPFQYESKTHRGIHEYQVDESVLLTGQQVLSFMSRYSQKNESQGGLGRIVPVGRIVIPSDAELPQILDLRPGHDVMLSNGAVYSGTDPQPWAIIQFYEAGPANEGDIGKPIDVLNPLETDPNRRVPGRVKVHSRNFTPFPYVWPESNEPNNLQRRIRTLRRMVGSATCPGHEGETEQQFDEPVQDIAEYSEGDYVEGADDVVEDQENENTRDQFLESLLGCQSCLQSGRKISASDISPELDNLRKIIQKGPIQNDKLILRFRCKAREEITGEEATQAPNPLCRREIQITVEKDPGSNTLKYGTLADVHPRAIQTAILKYYHLPTDDETYYQTVPFSTREDYNRLLQHFRGIPIYCALDPNPLLENLLPHMLERGYYSPDLSLLLSKVNTPSAPVPAPSLASSSKSINVTM